MPCSHRSCKESEQPLCEMVDLRQRDCKDSQRNLKERRVRECVGSGSWAGNSDSCVHSFNENLFVLHNSGTSYTLSL